LFVDSVLTKYGHAVVHCSHERETGIIGAIVTITRSSRAGQEGNRQPVCKTICTGPTKEEELNSDFKKIKYLKKVAFQQPSLSF